MPAARAIGDCCAAEEAAASTDLQALPTGRTAVSCQLLITPSVAQKQSTRLITGRSGSVTLRKDHLAGWCSESAHSAEARKVSARFRLQRPFDVPEREAARAVSLSRRTISRCKSGQERQRSQGVRASAFLRAKEKVRGASPRESAIRAVV